MSNHQLHNVRPGWQDYRADGAMAPVTADRQRPKSLKWKILALLIFVSLVIATIGGPLWYAVGTAWLVVIFLWLFVSGHFWTFGGGR
jgi:hypothetical protein